MSPSDHPEWFIREALSRLCNGDLPDGMTDTPARWIKAMTQMTEGQHEDPATILARTFDAEEYRQVVLVSGIDFVSLCEHHLMPFAGTASVAYLPKDRVVGLSKIPRLVDCFARRFQLQERLTKQVADAMQEHLNPTGVAVLVRATHSCLSARGAKKSGARMLTNELRGVFREDPSARAEIMALLGGAE